MIFDEDYLRLDWLGDPYTKPKNWICVECGIRWETREEAQYCCYDPDDDDIYGPPPEPIYDGGKRINRKNSMEGSK